MVRMKGWIVQTLPEIEVLHYRRIGTVKMSLLKSRFRKGIINYTLGYHPLFQLFISIYRFTGKPYIIGGLLMFSGYIWALLRKYDRPVSDDFVKFLRSEQLTRIRLKKILT